MGRQGREFQKVLLEISNGYDHESFEPPTGQSLLARLQGDIFKVDHLLDPTRAVDDNDVSIRLPPARCVRWRCYMMNCCGCSIKCQSCRLRWW